MPVDDIDINRVVFPGKHGGNIKVRNALISFGVQSFTFNIGVDGIASAVVGKQFVYIEQRRLIGSFDYVDLALYLSDLSESASSYAGTEGLGKRF